MKKVKVTEKNVVLSFTKKEFYVLLDLLDDRFNECFSDVESVRGIPVPKQDRPYFRKCELICKLDRQFQRVSDDIYLDEIGCPF